MLIEPRVVKDQVEGLVRQQEIICRGSSDIYRGMHSCRRLNIYTITLWMIYSIDRCSEILYCFLNRFTLPTFLVLRDVLFRFFTVTVTTSWDIFKVENAGHQRTVLGFKQTAGWRKRHSSLVHGLKLNSATMNISCVTWKLPFILHLKKMYFFVVLFS